MRSSFAATLILALVVFFVAGGWLLTRVDVVGGRAAARRVEAEAGLGGA